jgi:hypothetical protein
MSLLTRSLFFRCLRNSTNIISRKFSRSIRNLSSHQIITDENKEKKLNENIKLINDHFKFLNYEARERYVEKLSGDEKWRLENYRREDVKRELREKLQSQLMYLVDICINNNFRYSDYSLRGLKDDGEDMEDLESLVWDELGKEITINN